MLNQGATSQTDDPCLTQSSSVLRFAVFALLLLTVPSTAILLISLENRPYGIQLSSILGYTAAVALYTFSRNRNGNQPFLLACPVVRGQIPQLIRRHLGFLAALFIVLTMALKFRSNLPAHWITPTSRDASPFAIILGIFCLCSRSRRDSDQSFTSRMCPRLGATAIARFQRRHGVRVRPSLGNTQAGRGISLHDDCIFDCIIGARTGRKVLFEAARSEQ
jgi:hypothetical protein